MDIVQEYWARTGYPKKKFRLFEKTLGVAFMLFLFGQPLPVLMAAPILLIPLVVILLIPMVVGILIALDVLQPVLPWL